MLRKLWRRLFPGRWTAEELERINKEAHERWLRLQDLID